MSRECSGPRCTHEFPSYGDRGLVIDEDRVSHPYFRLTYDAGQESDPRYKTVAFCTRFCQQNWLEENPEVADE